MERFPTLEHDEFKWSLSMTDEVVSQLRKKIRGNVITPASSEYEIARKVYNGMIDRRPLLSFVARMWRT